jgi:hypothetical protein
MGMMKRETPVEIAKADKKPIRSCRISDSASAIVRKIGPYVNETLVKIEYMITGNCKAGIFARKTLTK